jgi:hypothetical protein
MEIRGGLKTNNLQSYSRLAVGDWQLARVLARISQIPVRRGKWPWHDWPTVCIYSTSTEKILLFSLFLSFFFFFFLLLPYFGESF